MLTVGVMSLVLNDEGTREKGAGRLFFSDTRQWTQRISASYSRVNVNEAQETRKSECRSVDLRERKRRIQ